MGPVSRRPCAAHSAPKAMRAHARQRPSSGCARRARSRPSSPCAHAIAERRAPTFSKVFQQRFQHRRSVMKSATRLAAAALVIASSAGITLGGAALARLRRKARRRWRHRPPGGAANGAPGGPDDRPHAGTKARSQGRALSHRPAARVHPRQRHEGKGQGEAAENRGEGGRGRRAAAVAGAVSPARPGGRRGARTRSSIATRSSKAAWCSPIRPRCRSSR